MKLNLQMINGSEIKISFELEPEESTLEAAYLLEYLTTGKLNAQLVEAASDFGKKTLRHTEISRVLTTWSNVRMAELPCIKPTEVLRMIHGQE